MGCCDETTARVPDTDVSRRALFKGAEQNEKGVIKIHMQDQALALDLLNKMQSSYVTRSLNINANVAVQSARDASPEDAMRLFDQFT